MFGSAHACRGAHAVPAQNTFRTRVRPVLLPLSKGSTRGGCAAGSCSGSATKATPLAQLDHGRRRGRLAAGA